MQFREFAQYLDQLDQTSKRLEITAILAKLYGSLEGEELRLASYLLLGSLTAQYESLQFMLSTKLVIRSLAAVMVDTSTGEGGFDLFGGSNPEINQAKVEELFKQMGDLGLVAQQVLAEGQAVSRVGKVEKGNSETKLVGDVQVTGGSASSAPGSTDSAPSITEVYLRLKAIALAGGGGSQEQKMRQLNELLQSLDPLSAKFVVRIVLGKLRLGYSTMTILDALSWAATGDKRDHDVLEDAYQKQADIGALAQTYLGAADTMARQQALETYTVHSGIPVLPALCQRLEGSEEVIAKMTKVIVEPKYDGLRAQIHIFTEGGEKKVRVFTRSLEDVTAMFPEAELLAQSLKVESAVLDSEAIGFDPKTLSLVAFQQTITRKRKHDVADTAQATPVKFFIFDILSLNGEPLLDEPLHQRKARLAELLSTTDHWALTEYIETSDPEAIRQFHLQQLGSGLEGIVIKKIDSPYQCGRKGWSWVKLKELAGETGKLTDTLDCVVLGYYYGQGKRNKFGVGAFLVGVLDDRAESAHSGSAQGSSKESENAELQLVTIAKIGTGLSDEQFRELKTRCDALTVESRPVGYSVPSQLEPNVWVSPSLVAEIAADEITDSPLHSAGVALRFPRLVKWRDDKRADQATALSEVAAIRTLSSPS